MMTRKEFLRSFAGLGVGAVGVAALAACGDDGGGTPDSGGQGCLANGTNAMIGSNHGHTMTVPREDVMAGTEKTYDIRGSSGHPHTVVVTAAMFTMLQGNTPVTATSSMDAAHTHSITINCA